MLRIPKRRIQRREIVLLAIAAVIFVFVFYTFILKGPLTTYRQSGVQVQQARLRLAQVQVWSEDVARVRAENDTVLKRIRLNPVNLYSFINGIVNEMALGTRAAISQKRSMTGVDTSMASVDIEMKGVNMEELVGFLHRLNDNDYSIALHQVRRLRPSLGDKGLDVQMTLVAPKI